MSLRLDSEEHYSIIHTKQETLTRQIYETNYVKHIGLTSDNKLPGIRFGVGIIAAILYISIITKISASKKNNSANTNNIVFQCYWKITVTRFECVDLLMNSLLNRCSSELFTSQSSMESSTSRRKPLPSSEKTRLSTISGFAVV